MSTETLKNAIFIKIINPLNAKISQAIEQRNAIFAALIVAATEYEKKQGVNLADMANNMFSSISSNFGKFSNSLKNSLKSKACDKQDSTANKLLDSTQIQKKEIDFDFDFNFDFDLPEFREKCIEVIKKRLGKQATPNYMLKITPLSVTTINNNNYKIHYLDGNDKDSQIKTVDAVIDLTQEPNQYDDAESRAASPVRGLFRPIPI